MLVFATRREARGLRSQHFIPNLATRRAEGTGGGRRGWRKREGDGRGIAIKILVDAQKEEEV